VLTPSLLAELQTAAGERALTAAAEVLGTEPDFLRAAQQVARMVPERLARAAVEQVLLRRRAQVKFDGAADLFFTREGLEQATATAVARHRAERFAGFPQAFDLGCGIGGDTLELARVTDVVGVDLDRLRLNVLVANAERTGAASRIRPVLADLERLPLRFPRDAAAFVDPGRRAGGRRLRGVDTYHPPLRLVLSWRSSVAGLAIKVSPAVRLEEVRDLGCEIEFVSLGGELKEAVLWFGALRRGRRRATVLPAGVSMEGEAEPAAQLGPLASFLIEPDPAVMRAGLVQQLGAEFGAYPIARDIAFLTKDEPLFSPFARTYRVVQAAPFRLKSLQRMLAERGVGRLTVKRRGSAVEPDDISRRLHLTGDREALVVLTRIAERQTMILAEPVYSAKGADEQNKSTALP